MNLQVVSALFVLFLLCPMEIQSVPALKSPYLEDKKAFPLPMQMKSFRWKRAPVYLIPTSLIRGGLSRR